MHVCSKRPSYSSSYQGGSNAPLHTGMNLFWRAST